MSKKHSKKDQSYVESNLDCLIDAISERRQPFTEKGKLPSLDADSKQLELTIKKLPKVHREALEKAFGLLGTTNHWALCKNSKTPLDHAREAMIANAIEGLKQLMSIDCLIQYDPEFKKLCDNLLVKIKRDNVNLSDIDCLKYLMVFLIFILDGPNIFFDSDGDAMKDPRLFYQDEILVFDDYALLKEAWVDQFKSVGDASFNVALVEAWVDNLDLTYKALVLQTVNLPIPKYLADYTQQNPPQFFSQIRKLKEKIFTKGPWKIFEVICFSNRAKLMDFEAFDAIHQKMGWASKKFPPADVKFLRLPQGVREVQVYKVGKYNFSDVNELDFLYLSRKLY
jgi:hypothetical protein